MRLIMIVDMTVGVRSFYIDILPLSTRNLHGFKCFHVNSSKIRNVKL